MTKQDIIAAAGRYFRKHPKATNREVNAMLRADYGGRFLARVTFDKIRALPFEIVFVRNVIPGQEVAALKRGGFLEREANYLWGGWELGINDPDFVAMRESRIQWWADMKRAGWTRAQIWATLRKQYKEPKYNPFDWLNAVYNVPKHKRITTSSQYQKAVKRQRHATKAIKPAFHLTKIKPRGKVTATLKGQPVEF